jgi:hypothetical protein
VPAALVGATAEVVGGAADVVGAGAGGVGADAGVGGVAGDGGVEVALAHAVKIPTRHVRKKVRTLVLMRVGMATLC